MTQPEDIVSRIALVFSSDEDFDFQLDQSFALIGKGLDISRCYLFVDSPDRSKPATRMNGVRQALNRRYITCSRFRTTK